MDYTLDTLPNGLRVITVELPNFESATLSVWAAVGSRYENPKISGISHFLEHMVFKGSKKRPTAKAISEAIDSFGGEFNASTSKEWTNFYIRARVGKIETAFDVLSDMVLNPILDVKEIEKEKGVICEEIAMYEDTPMAKIDDVFENLIFKGNFMATDIIGTKESVRGIQKSDFVSYRKSHYFTDNILLTVAGGVKRKDVIGLASKYFKSVKNSKTKEPEKFQSLQEKPQVLLKSKKNDQGHLIAGFLGRERGHEKRYEEVVLNSILGGGMSSRLFLEVREKRGLCYAVKSSSEYYKETGYLSVYAGVDLKRIDESIKVILDQMYGLASGKYKITNKELTKAKEYIKGHMALSLENTKAVGAYFGLRQLLLRKIETPQEAIEKINKVTAEGVRDYAKSIFKPSRLNLAVIGPFEDSKRFEKLL
ncbi:MAG: Peptidase M16 domain protein [Candidatus Woesebacteria bacterium GW2011_GWA1_39_21]|uniref:Peptidase M16 domain protein n=1 Tax=Candidatus Woesebacteria bacterium GW2011_GWA1_39_21 TaxID=1618550 RepID=A0A0G0NAU7_9BACT|nr:MAG: Peptidase M16 domain protein [Candidatus Woesebacteria bacterium GW2011_GWA1_39_21]